MDVNGRKCIAVLITLLTVLTGACIADCPPADLNGDCVVGIDDLLILADQWLAPIGCVGHIEDCADIVGSDGVNLGDFSQIASDWLSQGDSAVVINEIHYDHDYKVDPQEYVELYNNGIYDVDISGWTFSDGISFTFPQGTNLPVGGYVIVAENPARVEAKYAIGDPSLVYGPFEGSLKNEGERVAISNTLGDEVDEVDFKLGFPWPTVGDPVPILGVGGTGHSIQLVDPDTNNNLAGSWRSGSPSPTIQNQFADSSITQGGNIPPQIRQVSHNPQQPKSDQIVTVTAKVTDPDGVGLVKLHYQLVSPGYYIRLSDSQYNTQWTDIVMQDDGQNGDAVAGDNVYTVQVPAAIQTHRRLVRYRITVEDTLGKQAVVPYADDPQPNFAYFVYDGVPVWQGADQPGSTPVVTYNNEVLTSLPIYHLIANEPDVLDCQYNRTYDGVWFTGTLVYEGIVYDHIQYRNRGQASTYYVGKNKWKINFTRSHYFESRDDYGNKRRNKWNKMNIGTGGCPWWQYPHPGTWDQSTGGMLLNEAMGMRLYQMADTPACDTNFFHFRVIDDRDESTTDQYEGDFWGLYFTIEQADSRFLDARDLPDGNVYKMDGNPNYLNPENDPDLGQLNQGSTDPTDKSDIKWYTHSITGYNKTNPYQPLDWWYDHTDLEGYYSFKASGIAMNNSDPRPEQNCVYYHNPLTGQWTIMPWDLDLNFEWGMHYSTWENWRYVLSYEEADIAYENRGRELLDLLYSTDQITQLVDELASIIGNLESTPSMVDANRAMWDHHPRSVKKGIFYEKNEFMVTKDWPGMVQYYKDFLTTGFNNGYIYGPRALEDDVYDSAIPNTASISYTGTTNWPVNDLQFQVSSFGDPQGSETFAALRWRIAEVEADSSGRGVTAVLIQEQTDWKYFKGTQEASDPVDAWRYLSFDDSAWLDGQTSIGYGDNDDNTVLDDMQYINNVQDGYAGIYLRKKFTLTDPADVSSLSLDVYVDDGCIIWINGTEIARLHCSSGDKAYSDLSGDGHINNAVWESVQMPEPYDYLVAGENVVAIHVMNSAMNSSDVSIDVRLTAEIESGTMVPPDSTTFVTRGKYEIDAKWESSEITEYQSSITIPASEIKVGHTYRVRCRMKDDTRRWSHWSDAIQFVAGEPIADPVLDNLRITEIMYNPAPAPLGSGFNSDDYEFIELKNVGSQNFDLTELSFVNGVKFEFPVESAHWKFDESSGLTAGDSFGSNDGTLVGGPIWRSGSGQLGGALEFDGIDDNVVISNYYGPMGKRARTCSAWIKTASANDMVIMSWGEHGVAGARWKITTVGGTLSVAVGGGDSAVTGSTFLADNQWHHIAVSLEDIDGDDEMTVSDIRLYVDGQEETYSTRGTAVINTGNDMEVYIGSYNNGSFFAGMIDDVRIYNRSLNQTQIAADMASSSISLSAATSLTSGGFGLIVSNREAFESAYPAASSFIIGEYLGNLSNGGEVIELEDYTRGTVLDFEFKDSWYPITDGEGFSLTIIDELGDKALLGEKVSWRSGSTIGGTPGSDDTGTYVADGAVVINEVLAHSHAELPDWIELHNTTGSDINIGGWFLSDNDNDFKKYEIPLGTSIIAGQYAVFYEDQHFGSAFALSENGEDVYLSSGLNGELTGYSEQEDFGVSETGVSFGRYYKASTDTYSFVPMATITPNAENSAPKVGPVVISEIMYNPADGGAWDHDEYEYIELYNMSGAGLTLETEDVLGVTNAWKFTDGIDYTFPLGTTIAAGERIIVARNPIAFAERHTAPEGTQVLGPFANDTKLSNGGERVQLAMPGDVDAVGTRHYIRIDRVTYSDGSHPVETDPWPTSTDGGGDALERIDLNAYGNDHINWQETTASPGE